MPLTDSIQETINGNKGGSYGKGICSHIHDAFLGHNLSPPAPQLPSRPKQSSFSSALSNVWGHKNKKLFEKGALEFRRPAPFLSRLPLFT
jgi:hypothetical protein